MAIIDSYWMTLNLIAFPLVQLYGLVKSQPSLPFLLPTFNSLAPLLLAPVRPGAPPAPPSVIAALGSAPCARARARPHRPRHHALPARRAR